MPAFRVSGPCQHDDSQKGGNARFQCTDELVGLGAPVAEELPDPRLRRGCGQVLHIEE